MVYIVLLFVSDILLICYFSASQKANVEILDANLVSSAKKPRTSKPPIAKQALSKVKS